MAGEVLRAMLFGTITLLENRENGEEVDLSDCENYQNQEGENYGNSEFELKVTKLNSVRPWNQDGKKVEKRKNKVSDEAKQIIRGLVNVENPCDRLTID